MVPPLPGGPGGSLPVGVLPTSILPSQNFRNLFSWSSMSSSRVSNAVALRRTAAVVGNRRDVPDYHDVQASSGHRAHGRLAPGAGTFHAHFPALHPVLRARVALSCQ